MTTYTSPRNARVIEIDPEGRIVSVLDALQLRSARYAGGNVDVRPGRHRAPEPGLFARLFGRGSKGGA